jgi:4-amino-4-deoxy-L-arabinose transferase-like glycosyltransferase
MTGWRFAAGLVLAGAAVLFLARLGDRAIWSEEVRWAEIPREMVRSGDWFWPTINSHTYYDKPLGSYWLVLAASTVAGGVNETAARLPSALAGLAAVALLIALGRRFFDGRVGALAGAILTTSYAFTFFARTASTDVETVAGMLAALWIGTGTEDRWSGKRTLAFWLVMAATSLTKGLLGFALPLLVLGCYHTFAGNIRGVFARNCWLLNRWTLLAAPLAVAVYFAPFAVSISQTGSAEGLGMVWRENVRRFFDAHNHRGAVYLYAYVIFGLFAPWSAFLPAALLRRPLDRGDRFARAFFWAVFVFFTLSSSRRSYYLLPVIPASALLVSRLLLASADELTPCVRRLRTASYVVLAVTAVTAGLAAVVPIAELPRLPDPWVYLAGWVVAVAGVVLAAARFSPNRMALSAAAIAGWGIGYYYLAALPGLEDYRTSRPFLEQVRERVGSDEVMLYRTREAVWYLDPGVPLPEAESAEELAEKLESGDVLWGLLKEQDLSGVAERVRPLLRERNHPWEPADVVKGKLVLVGRK